MKHPRWLWWTSLLTALVAFGLGLYGYGDAASHCEAGCWRRDSSVDHFETLHATLQLYVSNLPGHDMHNWYIRSAALLAPLSLAVAALYAFWDTCTKIVVAARLWLKGADHLFIGTGERATAIALAKARFAHANHAPIRIAGLDVNDQTLFRERLLRRRSKHGSIVDVLILDGHAMARSDLIKINVRHADTIWITTGDDAVNLAIARRLADVIDDKPRMPYRVPHWMRGPGVSRRARRGRQLPRLLVRVERTRLVRAERAMHNAPKKLEIEYFNLGRLVARQLFKEHPPLIPPLAVSSDSSSLMIERPPHILLCGDGRHIESIALTAAIHWILDERRTHCVRITLIGRHADAVRDQLLAEHPGLARSLDSSLAAMPEYRQFADFRTLTCEADELEPDDWRNLQSFVPFDAVYVCAETDLSTARIALRVLALRDAHPMGPSMPVVALLLEESSRATSRESPSPQSQRPPLEARDFVWFNVYERLFANDECTPGDALDLEAKAINDQYARQRDPSLSKPLPTSRALWPAGSNDDFKWSSRFSAAHVDVKLMLLARAREDFRRHLEELLAGHRVETQGWLKELIDQHLPALSRLEHRRFVAERMIEGWLPIDSEIRGKGASGKSADEQKRDFRLNATLVPYDKLTIADRRYDDAIVLSIPRIVSDRQALSNRHPPETPWWLKPW